MTDPTGDAGATVGASQRASWVRAAGHLSLTALGSAIALLVVAFVATFLFAYFVWHPAEVRRTTPLPSTIVTFETKHPWGVVLLWSGGAAVGILIVVTASASTLWWIFRRRLAWPRIVLVPIWLLAAAAASAVAVIVGSQAVHEVVVLDLEGDAIELRRRSLTDVLLSGRGQAEVVRLADVERVEYKYLTMADSDGAAGPEARVRLRTATGRSVSVPTGNQPAAAYDLAYAIARAAGLTVTCSFENYGIAEPITCTQLPSRAGVTARKRPRTPRDATDDQAAACPSRRLDEQGLVTCRQAR